MKKFQNLKLLLVLVFLVVPFVQLAGNIDFKLYEIDSNINDMIWCGNNHDSILALTELSSVYKSDDHGFTWKKLNDIFQHTGKKELEENENEVLYMVLNEI